MITQFIHVETYGFRSAACKTTINKVINEALRVKANSKHVLSPLEPSFMYGTRESLALVPKALKRLTKASEKKTGKKVRVDAQLLGTAIASFPYTTEQTLEDSKIGALFHQWKHYNLKFAQEEWGNDLFCVLLHMDEAHPHMHIYCMPKLAPNGHIVLTSHPGRNANMENAHEDKARQRVLYIQALKAFQMRYHLSVGLPLGWTIKGEQPRKRLTNKQMRATQTPTFKPKMM